MAMNGIGASAKPGPFAMSRSVEETAVSSQRALVPVSRAGERPRSFPGRAAAPFLAHLIATAHGEPQTRERRRAEPARAAHAYATTFARLNRPLAGEG